MKLWKLLSAALMLWFAGNYFGFCFSQFRFLSDDQRKEFAAMLAYRHTTKQTVLTKDHRRIKIPAAYSSFADFMTKNPKCCEIQDPVVRWPEGPSFSDSLLDVIWRCFGMRAVRVLVKYRDWQVVGPNEELELRDTGRMFDVGNCGRVVGSQN